MYTKNSKWAVVLCALLLGLSANLWGQVNADFTADVTQGCSPVIVQFTDQSSGNITSWKWSFGNGNTSLQQNPGAVYVNSGSYDVRLIVSDGSVSDTIVYQNFITVNQEPVADFTVDVTQGCNPVTVNFTNATTPGDAPISSYVWNFGDGGNSYDANPTYTYDNPGIYNVTLLVVDQDGCDDNIVKTQLIEVGDVPQASFTADPTGACNPPTTVDFTNTSNHNLPVNYSWKFGEGNTSTAENPTNTYTALGSYDVELIVSNSLGCADTASYDEYITLQDIVADFEADVTHGCAPATISFTDSTTSGPNQWEWDFGDGTTSTDQNPVHTYNSPGTYTVTLTAANGSACSDSETKTGYITITNGPDAAFGASNTYSCTAPFTVNFIDSSTNAIGWIWDFGDGDSSFVQNPSHTYTTDGTFDVSLSIIGTDSCVQTLSKNDFINITPPQADFLADTTLGCVPITAGFTNLSTAGEPIVAYQWDFGNGSTSTQPNPTTTYTSRGEYDVTLIITTASGCSDTITQNNSVQVGEKPDADFTAFPLQACIEEPIQFNNLTDSTDQWFWHFGDGGWSNAQNPVYAYTDTSWFSVSLVAMDNGCPDTLTINDYIHVSPPNAAFGFDMTCTDPYTVQFNDGSLAPDTWYWDFGDSNSTITPSPVHTYTDRGTYTVQLTVEDSVSGCVDTETIDVVVSDPVAGFTADTTIGCHPLTVQFTDTSIDAAAWEWTAGNMTSTAQNPDFQFTTPGIYDVKLVITDVNGCQDSVVVDDMITVLGPVANFGGDPTQGCAPLNVSFTDSSSAFMSPITQWHWQFGNGDSAFTQNPVEWFEEPGTFDVDLTVTDANGCSNTLSIPDMVAPTFPDADFTASDTSCTGTPIQFTSITSGQGLNFFWEFGDADTSSQENPLHLYQSEGVYSVTLTVTDVNGCDSTVVKPDYITISDPVADFYADTTYSDCPPFFVSFADISTGNNVAWQWQFGDGDTSLVQNPTHVYDTPGEYDVTLITTSAYGCKDTMTLDDYVFVGGPYGSFEFTPNYNCVDKDIEFFADTTNAVSITWDFGDGTLEPNGPDTTTHYYDNPGYLHPSMILDDGKGCLFTVTADDSLLVGEIEANFAFDTTYQCKEGPVAFYDLSTSFPNINNWHWQFGDGDTSDQTNPVHYYDSPGLYDITLIASTSVCADTITYNSAVHIDEGPQADFSVNTFAGCTPLNATFSNLSTSDSTIVDWAWNFGTGDTSTEWEPLYVFDTVGVFDVQLVVTSNTGCTDTVVKQITVYDLPVANAGPDTTICEGETIMLNASGGIGYQWSPAIAISNDTIANPLVNPMDSMTYVLTVTDTNTCQAVDTINVPVNPIPQGKAGTDAEICEGGSVELWASGGVDYNWEPNQFVTCNDCPATVAYPEQSTDFVVEINNQFKCSDYDTVSVTVYDMPDGITTPNTTICVGESVQLETSGAHSIEWVPSTGLDCDTCQNPVATPEHTTEYIAVLYNEIGCEVNDTVTITVNPVPDAAIAGDSIICQGQELSLNASGGTSYNWIAGDSLSCTNCDKPVAYPQDSSTYIVEVTNNFNCVAYDTLGVDVKALPTVQTIDDLTLCEGDFVELTTTYGNTVAQSWSPQAMLDGFDSESPLAYPTQSTTYTVTATSAFGCTKSDTVDLNVIDKISTTVSDDIELCYGDSVSLNAEITEAGYEGAEVTWSPVNGMDDPKSLTPTVQPEETITYTMIASGGSCVNDTQQVTVTVHQLPGITITDEDGFFIKNDIETLNTESPDNLVSYNWSPAAGLSCTDCAEPELTVEGEQVYTVTAFDENGCMASDDIYIQVVDHCGEDIFVANTFTPNSDEVNDELYVRGLTIERLNYFRVFDRWGNLIFETSDINKGWDGTIKGSPANGGVYVYSLEAICTNGFAVRKQGNTTLIR